MAIYGYVVHCHNDNLNLCMKTELVRWSRCNDMCLAFVFRNWTYSSSTVHCCIFSNRDRLRFYAELPSFLGTVRRFRVLLGQCGDSEYCWDSAEIQSIVGTVRRFRVLLGQCRDSEYCWDSAEIQIIVEKYVLFLGQE